MKLAPYCFSLPHFTQQHDQLIPCNITGTYHPVVITIRTYETLLSTLAWSRQVVKGDDNKKGAFWSYFPTRLDLTCRLFSSREEEYLPRRENFCADKSPPIHLPLRISILRFVSISRRGVDLSSSSCVTDLETFFLFFFAEVKLLVWVWITDLPSSPIHASFGSMVSFFSRRDKFHSR